MKRCWLALCAERPADAVAAARAGDEGRWLAAWSAEDPPVPDALRVHGAIVDADGPAGWVSLVLAPPGAEPPFDDPVVQGARRRVLAGAWPAGGAVSTLLRDDSRFAGAITFAPIHAALADDPFARIHPARILELRAGLLRGTPPPAGPVIERYGSAQPWPADRF